MNIFVKAKAILLRKIVVMAACLYEKVGDLLGENIDLVVKNLECEDSDQTKPVQKVIGMIGDGRHVACGNIQ